MISAPLNVFIGLSLLQFSTDCEEMNKKNNVGNLKNFQFFCPRGIQFWHSARFFTEESSNVAAKWKLLLWERY